MQRWADAKVFAFVNLRSTDAKAFCQSSACVPEILLRLASVCMGEWVNTVGRTIRFLKIRVRVKSFAFASFAFASFMFTSYVFASFAFTYFAFASFGSFVFASFWGMLCLPPLRQQNAFMSDAQKRRKRRRGRERRDADTKDAMRTRQPSSVE